MAVRFITLSQLDLLHQSVCAGGNPRRDSHVIIVGCIIYQIRSTADFVQPAPTQKNVQILIHSSRTQFLRSNMLLIFHKSRCPVA